MLLKQGVSEDLNAAVNILINESRFQYDIVLYSDWTLNRMLKPFNELFEKKRLDTAWQNLADLISTYTDDVLRSTEYHLLAVKKI